MKLLNSIKKDFNIMTLVLIPIAIVINSAVDLIVVLYYLPIHPDSIGTVLVAAACGPWAGALTGVLSAAVWGLIIDPSFFAGWLMYFCIGFVAGWCTRMGLFKSWQKAVITGLLIALSSILVNAAIQIGDTANTASFFPDNLLQILFSSSVNKVATSLLAFAILQSFNFQPEIVQPRKGRYGMFQLILIDTVDRLPIRWRSWLEPIVPVFKVLLFLLELPLNFVAWLATGIFYIVRFLLSSALILIMIVQILILRWAVKRRVDKLMRKRLGDEIDESLPELASAEIESGTKLEPEIFSASTESNQTTISQDFLKNKIGTRRRPLVGDLMAALGYFAISIILVWIPASGVADSLMFILFFTTTLLVLAITRYIDLYLQFLPKYTVYKMMFPHAFAYVFQKLNNVAKMFTWFITSELLLAISLIVNLYFIIITIESHLFLATIGLLLAGGLHIILNIRFRQKTKDNVNIRLLILRTFDIDENTMFIFGRLTTFWKNLGNFYTVVDQSLLHQKYNRWSSRGMRLFVIMSISTLLVSLVPFTMTLFFLAGGANSVQELVNASWPVFMITFLVCSGPVLLLVVLVENRNIHHDFIKNRANVQLQIERIEQRPRYMNQSFKGLQTMCHANTWKGTVAELVKNTDVVLMDLRGFSPEKKGCEYELDFLLDNISLSRVVLLADVNNSEYISETVSNLWRKLRVDSPNLGVKDPKVQIYVSGTEDELDVQGVYDLLIASAVLSGRAGVGTKSKQVVAPPIPESTQTN